MKISIDSNYLKDEQGRVLLFRGVNLSGSSKLPFGKASHLAGAAPKISFIGRPFPLADADEHFDRLRTWGFNLIRLVVTWEAIEHAGPSCYDESYLEYLHTVVQKASDYDFSLYIDPHQDVWSRFSGGDGAPAWTLEMVGFELDNLSVTGAATLHAIHGNPFPHMIWGTNYGKLASATMFTLFWGSEDFAPKTNIAGESAKCFLQRHYIAAFKHLAKILCDVPQVLGYGIMNEPSPGFIGMDNLNQKAHALLLRGHSPSAFESMRLGAGFSEQVEVWELGWRGLQLKHLDILNREQVRAWQQSKLPVWQDNGVWSHQQGQSKLLNPQHFAYVKGSKVNFYRDYYLPFAKNYIANLREVHPEAYFFVEGIPADLTFYWQGDEPIIHAPHWYDVATLVRKRYSSWLSYDIQRERFILGKKRINKRFIEQVATLKKLTRERLNNVPMLIGEVGVPMDMHSKHAYRSGDFSKQVQALDHSLRIMEQNLVGYILWNYTPDNCHEYGDLWNGEDFSIFSPDDVSLTQLSTNKLAQKEKWQEIYSGGRALEAAIRPHAFKIAGVPTIIHFDLKRRRFELHFTNNDNVCAPSVIFVPQLHYPEGYEVRLSDGYICKLESKQQLLYYHTTAQKTHWLHLFPIESK